MTPRFTGRVLALLLCFGFSVSASAQRFYYLGTVGDRPVQLELSVSSPSARGHYYYDAVGLPLDLEGTVTPEGAVHLSEYTQAVTTLGRQRTGRFEGTLTSDADTFGQGFSGTWRSPGGDALPFELDKVAEYADISFEQNRIAAAASYPVFGVPFGTPATRLQSDLINSLFDFVQEGQEAWLAGEFSGWSLERLQTVTYASASLVSVAETLYVYTGGAHPNTGLSAYTLLADGDRVRRLGLPDFFLPEVDYLALLSPYVVNALLEQGAQWVVDGSVDGFTGDDLSVVTVSPTGLRFGFEPYAVGPYAQGTFFVTVPFEVLGAVIDPAGPLRAFVE